MLCLERKVASSEFFFILFEVFVGMRKTKFLFHTITYFWKIWDAIIGCGMESLAPLLLTQTLMTIYLKGGPIVGHPITIPD